MSIQSQINRIKSAKSAIAAAIANKGVTVPSGTSLDGMAALIDMIVVAPAPSYSNVLASAIGYDGAILNGRGYIDGYRLTGSQTVASNLSYLTANASYFATGFIPYTIADAQNCVPFYVKGVNLESGNLGSYSRISMYSGNKASEYAEVRNMTDASINGVSITKLGDLYYRITPNSNFYYTGEWRTNNAKFIRFSMPGSGSGVIMTVNEPIE
jgi:hypothetical protein